MLARDNDWGDIRILGDLRKLGLMAVSRNTVKNILMENGLEPGPKRGAGTWEEFLKMHAATLWQCDFCAKKVLTVKAFRDLFLLVFLHVETRRLFIAPSSFHPDEAWVKQQAETFLKHAQETGLGAVMLMHDRDTKFTSSFDEVLESGGLKVVKTAYRSPNTVAFVERFIQTLQQEVLGYFIVFGEQHMDHIVSEALAYYPEERPHHAKDNDPLVPAVAPTKSKQTKGVSPDVVPVSQITCRERIGGLLKHYSRKAA
jgi:putative transposase